MYVMKLPTQMTMMLFLDVPCGAQPWIVATMVDESGLVMDELK